MIEVQVKGLEEVKRGLEDFSARVSRRVVSESLAAGARLMADAIRPITPVRQTGGVKKLGKNETRQPGNLRRRIQFMKQKKKVPRGQVKWLAGPNRQGYYGYFVEKGHAAGKRKKYGRGITESTGLKMVPAHPFVMPTFNAMQGTVLNVIVTDMQIGIAEAARKAGFKPITGGSARL